MKTARGNLGIRIVNSETGEETYAAAARQSSIAVLARERFRPRTGARVARPEAGGVYIVRRGADVFKVRY